MKKTMALIAISCIWNIVAAKADNDKVIQVSNLPVVAQEFIKKNFTEKNIAIVKVDKDLWDKDYNVVFKNGNEIEFDKNGNWKEIKCKATAVPLSAVPKQIAEYIQTNYPDAKILSIDKDRKDYEVKLSNKWELKFNLKCQLIDLED